MRRSLAFTVAAASILALAACGDSDNTNGSGNGDDAEQVTVSVGVLPIMPTAAFRLGVEKGFFADEGINIELEEIQSGSAAMAAVVSGEYDVGFASIVPQMQAQVQGMPIKAFGPGSTSSSNQGLMVKEDSDITEPADLNGKRIAVVTLRAIDELAVLGAADALGADSSTFEMLSVPFPEMLTAIDADRVDAIEAVEPFYTAALGAGLRAVIEEPIAQVAGQDSMNSGYFTSASYLEENQDVIDRFARALAESNTYATDNPDEVAQFIPTYTSISLEVAETVIPTRYMPTMNVESYEIFADLMVEYDVVDTRPDLDALIYEPDLGSE